MIAFGFGPDTLGDTVFLLLFALMGKKDCFRLPMNAGWCIQIGDTHIPNAIGLMLPEIPN